MRMKRVTDIFLHYWCVWFRHTRKNSHLFFFIGGLIRLYTPKWILRLLLERKLERFFKYPASEKNYILDRVNHYCLFHDDIFLPDDAPMLEKFRYKQRENYIHDYVNSTYFFDAHEYIRYFNQTLRWAYNPGDVNYLFPVPEITKSRPIAFDLSNRNNILLNLDKVRHFTWIHDPFTWEEKECRVIFRGDIGGKPHRQRFIEMWKEHPWCDLSDVCTMKLYEHLRYRYIMALEGNDVASNLKWVMSSNSIAVMPQPKFETWFMESRLIPNVHYIEIAADYSNLIERITYYEQHPEEAKQIVRNAHEWVRQFQDKEREDIISLMVLDKYFALTHQRESSIMGNRKYIINDLVKINSSQKINAQGKAREDVLRTMMDAGYERLDILNPKYSWGEGKRYHHYPLWSDFISKREAGTVLQKVKYGDTVFIQDFHLKHMQWLSCECRKKGAQVIFLIHDIQCIRFDIRTKEVDQVNNASLLLVHTEAMAQKLRELGVTTPMKVITLFDYYSDDQMLDVSSVEQRKKEVIFAGNLSKSVFLDKMTSDIAGDIKINLYGFLGDKDFSNHSEMSYKGTFQPNHTGKIEGGWGLVWDGDSTDSCIGELGGYLKYNSSHKISLYLSAGIPLIVWKESSLADFVKDRNCGITVENIAEITKIVSEMSQEDYQLKIQGARQVGEQLRKGEFLKISL